MKNPYAHIPTSIWLLAATTLISRSGSMVLLFLPLYLIQKLHFSIIITGQIVSLYGLGEIVGSYLGGMSSDRFGHLRVQTTSLLLGGTFYLLLEFLQHAFAIMLVMFCIGCFNAAIRPAVGSMINKFCAPQFRSRAFSLNYQAMNLGAAIGPAIGGLLAGIDYMWLFRIDGCANILASVFIWYFLSHRSSQETFHVETDSITSVTTSIWQDKSFLIFLGLLLLIGMCFFQLLNVYPVFLRADYHLTEFQIGLIMALNGALIIFLQMPLSMLLQNYHSLQIIKVGAICICLGYVILPWSTGFHYALLSITIITMGEMLVMPFSFDFVSQIAPARQRGLYLGFLGCSTSSIPLLLTPNIMPYIYTEYGANTLWYLVGFIGIMVYVGLSLLNKSYQPHQ